MIFNRFQWSRGRLVWMTLLAASLSAGMAQRVWADIDVDDDDGFDVDVDDGYDPPRDVHVHLPGIHIDVQRRPVVVVPEPPPPPPEPEGNVALPAEPIAAPPPATSTSFIVETRGPIHEAFAEPVVYDPTPGITVTKAPPAALDEVPPDQQPEGDNVQWIPGYWAWDDDRTDYVWVSGIWRNLPPDRQFVPGYWAQSDEGYQWVPGFWQSERVETVTYLPDPPQSLETGPAGDAPGPNFVWVPGVWLWRANNYVWRPGYWMPPQENWVWVPAHYTWAPAGYIFVSGYWDYVTPRRGVLFAPVYAPPAVVAQRVVYTPSVVVNAGALVTNLFARPRYGHYYFGDYFDRAYFRQGIYPAYSFQESRIGYSPLLTAYVAREGGNRTAILSRLRDDYRFRREHAEYRPPRTYTALQELAARRGSDPRLASFVTMAQPLRQYTAQRSLPLRFRAVDRDNLNMYRQTIAQGRQYQNERQRLETQRLRGTVIGPTPPTGRTITPDGRTQIDINREAQINEQQRQAQLNEQQRRAQLDRRERQAQLNQGGQRQPLSLKLNRSPFVARPGNQANRSITVPPRPKAAKPDPNIRPGARKIERPEPSD